MSKQTPSKSGYVDPERFFETLRGWGSMPEDFYNARNTSSDPHFRSNVGAVRLVDRNTGIPIGRPSYPTLSNPVGGSSTTWGHSERSGMRELLDDFVDPSDVEILRPSDNYRSRHGSSGLMEREIYQALVSNAPEYKKYIERKNPNAIIQMLSERPGCANRDAEGGACPDFIENIFPSGSTYRHTAENGSIKSVREAFNKLHTNFLITQSRGLLPSQVNPPIVQNFVPRGNLGDYDQHYYNKNWPIFPGLRPWLLASPASSSYPSGGATTTYYPGSSSSSSSSSGMGGNPYNSSSSSSSSGDYNGTYPSSSSSPSTSFSTPGTVSTPHSGSSGFRPPQSPVFMHMPTSSVSTTSFSPFGSSSSSSSSPSSGGENPYASSSGSPSSSTSSFPGRGSYQPPVPQASLVPGSLGRGRYFPTSTSSAGSSTLSGYPPLSTVTSPAVPSTPFSSASTPAAAFGGSSGLPAYETAAQAKRKIDAFESSKDSSSSTGLSRAEANKQKALQRLVRSQPGTLELKENKRKALALAAKQKHAHGGHIKAKPKRLGLSSYIYA